MWPTTNEALGHFRRNPQGRSSFRLPLGWEPLGLGGHRADHLFIFGGVAHEDVVCENAVHWMGANRGVASHIEVRVD